MVNNGFLKASLLALCFNLTFGKSFYNSNDFTLATNYTLDTIKSFNIKTACQTLSDCSEDALECRKDNNNKSYCVYPEYLCSNAETCYLVNNHTLANDTSFINSLNATSECTQDEECPSNKCTSGQCQVSIDSAVMYCQTTNTVDKDNTTYQCGKIIGDHCETNSDCITSNCDSNTKICLKNDNQTKVNNNKNEGSSKKSYTLYIVIGLGVVIGIVLIVITIFVCGHSVEYMDENPDLKQFRKENESAAGVINGVVLVM